jgi:curved DNA-binding protein CbpA
VMMALLWVADATECLEWASPAPEQTSGSEAGGLFDDDDILAFINAEVGTPPAAATAPTQAASADTPVDRLARLAELARDITAADHHFAVLGLPYDAPTEQFRQAYMRLARDLHPDRFAGTAAEDQDRAAELFDRIRAAWDVINDSEARRKYTDTKIHGKKSEDDQAMEEVQRFWNAEGDFRRGLAAFNAGRLNSAHELFRTAHQAFPDELEFKTYFTYTKFAIEGAGATADSARRALDALLDVIERNSRQERKLDAPHVLMGRIHLAQGDLDQARKCFISALRLNPANADAQLQMRRVDAELKKPVKKGFFATLFGKKS